MRRSDVAPLVFPDYQAFFGPEILADVDDLYSTSATVIADVTGDGVDDLVAASHGVDDGRLLVFRWDGDSLELASDTRTSGYPLETLAVGDVLGLAGPAQAAFPERPITWLHCTSSHARTQRSQRKHA